MKNKERKITYKLLSKIVGGTFKLFYKIIVIGKENIPEEGRIIICGNHNHAHDQMPIILNTKRIVHYMAKKEYFDTKFGWLFEISGCIPVDRTTKDESAKNKAIEVLKNDEALGIFPEGTRNEVSCKKEVIDELYKLYENEIELKRFKKILKENRVRLSMINYLKQLKDNKIINNQEYKEYILNPIPYLEKLVENKKITKEEYEDSYLLPLKFGTVSMAKKTNSKIIPFATNSEYKIFGKKPKVIIGTPIDVSNLEIEEANEKLRKELIKLLLEVLKNEKK